MTDRPILFSGPMVRAIWELRKWNTRRILKPQPSFRDGANPNFTGWRAERVGKHRFQIIGGMGVGGEVSVPIEIGDRLWVRETWRPLNGYDAWDIRLHYPANDHEIHLRDGDRDFGDWRWPKAAKTGNVPAIHMPRWASRITLLVTDVRVERLQDISREDCVAEGCKGWVSHDGQDGLSPEEEIEDLWKTINGPDSWSKNPWVAAYTFETVLQNIDMIEAAA